MADAPEHVQKTLEDFKRQLSAKMLEAAQVLAVVNALEERLGLPKTSLSGGASGITWSQSIGEEVRVSDPRTATSTSSIRPDEYLGEVPLEAAKKYLKRIRQAAHIDEIADAVLQGGAAIKGADWKEELDRSLLRSVREVVKVRERTYGLVQFYTEEQLKGVRAIRRQALAPKNPRRGRPKKRGRPRKEQRKESEDEGGG